MDANVFMAQNQFNKVKTERRVRIPKEESTLQVIDQITCSTLVVLLWNIGTDVEEIVQQDNMNNDQNSFEWMIRTKKAREYLLTIAVSGQSDKDKISMHMFEGALKPMLGWYAPGYLKKVPAKTIMLQFSPAEQMVIKVITQVTRTN